MKGCGEADRVWEGKGKTSIDNLSMACNCCGRCHAPAYGKDCFIIESPSCQPLQTIDNNNNPATQQPHQYHPLDHHIAESSRIMGAWGLKSPGEMQSTLRSILLSSNPHSLISLCLSFNLAGQHRAAL